MNSGGWAPLPGMADIAAPEISVWQDVEAAARRVLGYHGFSEIRTPVLERSSLFVRAIGEATDVVQKEMFAFEDRGGRAVALRPEGTAGVIRALCQAGADVSGTRVFYIGPMFRAERPQAGRRRQFHQLGVEAIGPPSPAADADCIAAMAHLLDAWGLEGGVLRLASRGVAEDRATMRAGLVAALKPELPALCAECVRRYAEHPLRVLDCKQPGCQAVVSRLPPLTTLLSEPSRLYLERVRALLERMGVSAAVDPRLVRGLDYYEHTIWEAAHPALGAQDAIAGGGRYRIDTGGRVVEGVGFAIGLERVMLALAAKGAKPGSEAGRPTLWLVAVGERALDENLALAHRLRRLGVACQMDLAGRSVKAQMRAADRARAPWVAVRGEDELAAGTCRLKNLSTGEESVLSVDDLVRRFAPAAPA